MLKKNIKIFSIFSFFLSLVFTFSIGEIFYNSIDGTDFYRYFRYIEYFNGTIESPSREQGLFYFWFISLFIEFGILPPLELFPQQYTFPLLSSAQKALSVENT